VSLGPAVPDAEARATRQADRLAWPALALFVLVLFSGAIVGGQAFFERDILAYWCPQAVSFVRAVGEEGVPPLWSPYFAFGLPMLEDPGYQVAYPFTWLNLLVEPRGYFVAFVAVHTLLAAAGLLRFARRLGLGSLPALTAALAWSASGPLLSAVNLNHHFASLAWLPWLLLAFDRCLARGTVGDVLALGSFGGLQALAGSGDVCLLSAALCLGLAGYRWAASEDRGALGRRLLRTAPAALALAAGLSAVQTLPTLWLVRDAPRVAQGPAASLYWSIHPLSLLDLVVDRIVAGFPMTPSLRFLLFESRAPFLSSLYLGLPAAWLVALGLLLPGRARAATWILAGFATCVLLALGRHTPVLPLVLELAAPVGVFRFPAKAMLPASLLWALLVGLGWATWQRPWTRPDRRRALMLVVLAIGSGVVGLVGAGWVAGAPPVLLDLAHPDVVAGGTAASLGTTAARLRAASSASLALGVLMAARLACRLPPAWLTAGSLLLVLGDLALAGRTVNALAPKQLLSQRPPILALLPPDSREARIYAFAPGLGKPPVRGPAGWEPSAALALGAVEALRPPSGARFRLAGSYDGDFTGLAPPALSSLTRLSRQGDVKLAIRLFQLGSVDYVVAVGSVPFPGLISLGEHASVFPSPVSLYRVPDPLPRAYWVGRARLSEEPGEAIAALADPLFDPRREVILPAGSPLLQGSSDAAGVGRILDRRSDRLSVEVSAGAPGYLVVAEAYHRGWRATVDGRPATVMPANVLFRAVAVPAGRHLVEMVYRPPSVFLGLGISALAALAAGAAWLVCLAPRAAARRRVAPGLAAK
jgi:hypothetical protein